MEAVNPVLQSAILDKFGKPFAQKSAEIVDKMDLTADKQDVVIEKQNTLTDAIKDVVSSIKDSTQNIKASFGKASDGIKELSFGFVDIKGIVGEVNNKFGALKDVLAPLIEIGAALGVTGFFTGKIGKKQKTQDTDGTDDIKDVKKSGFAKLKEAEEDIRRKKLGRGGRFKEDIGKSASSLKESFLGLGTKIKLISKAFGGLIIGMLPVIAKFLLIGGLITLAAVGIGKLIGALGGWELLEKAINGIQNVIGRLQNGFRQLVLALDTIVRKVSFGKMSILDDDERAEKQQAIEDERDRRYFSKERAAGNVPEGATFEDGKILDKDKNVISIRKGTEAYEQKQLDVKQQQELDVLALESVKRLPELQKKLANAKNEKQKESAEKAIEAANNFITRYNETHEVSAEDRFAKMQEEKGKNIFGKQKEVSLNDVVKSVEEQHGVELEGNIALKANKYINDASRTGDIIKEQTAEGKTDFIDNFGSGGALASVMQPSLIQNNNSTFEMGSQPAFEGINT